MAIKLSCVIIAGNAQALIKDCLLSAKFADEIILVAANSNDNTVNLAKKIIPSIRVYKTTDEYNKNFSKWRNIGYQHATGSWIFYLDTDERVPPALQKEIINTIKNPGNYSYFVLPRANHFLGKRVFYGGSYPDYVKRLYQKKYFKGYRGNLHEEPIIEGDLGYLRNDLLHFTHLDLNSMLQKSIAWTETEALALFQSGHPPVVWWRFPRMMLTKIWERLIVQSMWRDGTVGWISVVFESFNTFIIYARLWELQQTNKQ